MVGGTYVPTYLPTYLAYVTRVPYLYPTCPARPASHAGVSCLLQPARPRQTLQ